MTMVSGGISLCVMIVSIRGSNASRKKTEAELTERESRIIRPTSQEIEKYGRTTLGNRLIEPPIKTSGRNYPSSGEGMQREWVRDEFNDLALREQSINHQFKDQKDAYHQTLRDEQQLFSLVRWTALSMFFGVAGLSYFYLKSYLYQSLATRAQLEMNLRHLRAENDISSHELHGMLFALREHASSQNEKARWERALAELDDTEKRSMATKPEK